MHLVLDLLSRLPLAALYRVSGALFVIAYRLLRWRRGLADANLASALPELTRGERERILAQSYRNLADVVVEAIWAHRAPPEAIAARVAVEAHEAVIGDTRAGRSVLLMTAHFCNWEWQVLAGNLLLDRPMIPVYKPQRLRPVDRFLRETRSQFGGEPVPYQRLARMLLKRRSEALVYALVADQTPKHAERKVWTRFLGRETAFFAGSDTVARVLQAPVYFIGMRRVARGRYVMSLRPLAQPPYAKTDELGLVLRYARALEDEIRASPADWLWIHNKWKYPRPAAAQGSHSIGGTDFHPTPEPRSHVATGSEA